MMPIHNSEVAAVFSQVADLLEIEGANEFRVRACRKAARTVGDYPQSMADLLDDGQDLTDLSGIGEDLANKIKEIVKTGELAQLEKIKQRTPASLAQMLSSHPTEIQLYPPMPKKYLTNSSTRGVSSCATLVDSMPVHPFGVLRGHNDENDRDLCCEPSIGQEWRRRARRGSKAAL